MLCAVLNTQCVVVTSINLWKQRFPQHISQSCGGDILPIKFDAPPPFPGGGGGGVGGGEGGGYNEADTSTTHTGTHACTSYTPHRLVECANSMSVARPGHLTRRPAGANRKKMSTSLIRTTLQCMRIQQRDTAGRITQGRRVCGDVNDIRVLELSSVTYFRK